VLAEKPASITVLKEYDFTACRKNLWATALKGHGFIRAAKLRGMSEAIAAESFESVTFG
jgi:hypothetical protein